jgi:MSHA biogenesis protein MshQ
MKRLLTALLVLLSAADAAWAATYYSRGGNWNSTSGWRTGSCGGTNTTAVPGAADDVVICNNMTVTVNVNSAANNISFLVGNRDSTLRIDSGRTLTVAGTLTINGPNDTRTKLVEVRSGATLAVTGAVSVPGGSADNRISELEVDTGGVVTAAGGMTLGSGAGSNRGLLTFNGAGTVTITGSLDNTSGGRILNTGASVVQVTGDFTQSGTYTSSTDSVFRFNGSGAQGLLGSSAPTFAILSIQKSGGDLTLSQNVVATASLAFSTSPANAGRVVTGANTLTVNSGGTIPGAGTTSYVIGNLARGVPTGTQTVAWPVGGTAAGTYAPVTIAFVNVATSGTFTVAASTGSGDSGNIGTSQLDPAKSVNRFWTITNSGGGPANTTASVTFGYQSADVDSGATQALFSVGRYAASAWSYPSLGTVSAGSAQITAVATANLPGEYAVAEPLLYSHWKMDEPSWNGTANEVVDSGSGGNHGTAAGLTTRPTTANTTPALAGSPGTCRYGVFNRSNKDYVALSAYPNLAAAAGGFTVSAWIRTTDRTRSGQRIMIDDQNNTVPGSWGFSLADSGTPGALRFFYRQSSLFIMDTASLMSDNVWYFAAVSVSLVAGANASRATLYVYNTSGTQVGFQSNTFTWDAGSDAGPASIGGETNASGEGTTSFGFSGNLDELRVHRMFLTEAQIQLLTTFTRPCASLDHIRIEHDASALTCSPETVTVKACADSSCSTLYTATATSTTLSPTGWVGGNTISFTGSTTVSLVQTTAATVTLGAASTSPTPSGSTQCNNGTVTNTTTACQLTYADSGFVFDVANHVSGTTQTVTIQALKSAPPATTCVPAFGSVTRGIKFWTTYSNPSTGTVQVRADPGTVADCVGCTQISTASGSPTTLNLSFGPTATATFSLFYADVGNVRLDARYDGSAGTSDTGLVVLGNDSFIAKPSTFVLSGIQTTTGSVANPAAADETGAAFMKSGDNFTVTVTARNAKGATTPNFGKETSPEGVTLTSTLVAPAAGAASTISKSVPGSEFGTGGMVSDANGVATVTDVSWSEVGIITLTPTLTSGNYLSAAGAVTGTTSGNIGRFTPHRFVLSAGTLTNRTAAACASASSFTYLDEGIGLQFTLTAQNAGGATTTNYRGVAGASGSFAKLNLSSAAAYSFGVAALAPVTAANTSLGSRATITSGPTAPGNAWTLGAATVSATLRVGRQASGPDGPWSTARIGVDPTDTDGIKLLPAAYNVDGDANGSNERVQVGSSTELRYGRLRLQNAQGSERLALPIPLTAQYWQNNGTIQGFVTNTLDSCTAIGSGSVGLGSYQGSLASGETTLSPATLTLSSGTGNFSLSAPGVGNSGSLDLVVNLGTTTTINDSCTPPAWNPSAPTPAASNLDYLRGAWCTTTWDRDPKIRARFGTYTAPRQFIFQRENY